MSVEKTKVVFDATVVTRRTNVMLMGFIFTISNGDDLKIHCKTHQVLEINIRDYSTDEFAHYIYSVKYYYRR